MSTQELDGGRQGGNETAERLLDAAETLFADFGVSGTSLRQITTEAKANLASVSYHFGSKDGLLREVLGRRINPVNEVRMRMLDALEAGDVPPTVEQILDAFLRPIFDQAPKARQTFTRLMSRLHHSPDPVAMEYLQEVLGPIAMRTLGALTRALPGVEADRIFLRAHFMIGSMLHCLSEWDPRDCVPDLPVSNLKQDQLLEELVQFSSAGFMQLVPKG
ncbi:MAG: TetR family transcriptional regulator [Planctomycetota bacterium]|nr:TetR family transcriptional regulator [Planctomycetota bacterium]MDG2144366.1 TetR family transcriptional regulator [Planctomycetota bacterium]